MATRDVVSDEQLLALLNIAGVHASRGWDRHTMAEVFRVEKLSGTKRYVLKLGLGATFEEWQRAIGSIVNAVSRDVAAERLARKD